MATANTKNKSTLVADKQSSEVTVSQSQMPAYLQNQSQEGRGSENVSVADLVVPRLELVQSISPCLDESEGAFISGSKAGDLFNNVTRQNYGPSATVIPVYFKKEYIIWKDRKKGGGFVASFDILELAKDALNDLESPDDHKINDTANHFCLILNPDTNKYEEIVVSMAVSKLKVSRIWNSLIRLAGGDAFSRLYTLGSITETNKSDEKYKNLTIKSAGFPEEPAYRRAENLYLAVSAGQVKVNQDQEQADAAGGKRTTADTDY